MKTSMSPCIAVCTSCCPFVQFACQCCNLTWPHTQLTPAASNRQSFFVLQPTEMTDGHFFKSWIKLLLFFLHWAFEKRSRDITAVKRCSHLPRDVTTRPLVSATCAAAGELHRPQSAPGEGRTYTPSAAANQLTRWLWAQWLGESMTSCFESCFARAGSTFSFSIWTLTVSNVFNTHSLLIADFTFWVVTLLSDPGVEVMMEMLHAGGDCWQSRCLTLSDE